MAEIRYAKVIRGVGVRGVPKAEGTILKVVDQPRSGDEITKQDYWELKSTNYVVAYEPPIVEDKITPKDEVSATVAKGAKK